MGDAMQSSPARCADRGGASAAARAPKPTTPAPSLLAVAALLLAALPAGAAGRLALVLADGGDGTGAEVAAALTAALAQRGVQAVHGPALAGPAGEAAAGFDLTATGRVEVTGYRVDAEVIESTAGRPLARETVSGSAEQVFDLVDDLGRRLALQVRGIRLAQGTVGVLPFANRASPASSPFVSGIPHMLLTCLRQDSQLSLVETHQVDQGLAALDAGPGEPLTAGRAAELGRWLGAGAAVTGAFTDLLRVELDLAAAGTGRSLGRFERRGPRSGLPELAAGLAQDLEAAVSRHRRSTRTVAVLPFQNHGEERYGSFVNAMADMLTTSLGKTARLIVTERVQIETAMRNFDLEMSGPIDAQTAVAVGAWLGADAVVLGSFLRFGGTFRIDARMIDAATGEVLVAQSARGPEEAVMDMVDDLGRQLVAGFDERDPAGAQGTGRLDVVFRTVKSEMGERPVYHHLCKLYVDGEYLGLSPLVDQADRWVTLLSRGLRSGRHQVQVVHGYAKGREWDGQMPLQPEGFAVWVEDGATATVRYTYEVGWFTDRYLYETNWNRAPASP